MLVQADLPGRWDLLLLLFLPDLGGLLVLPGLGGLLDLLLLPDLGDPSDLLLLLFLPDLEGLLVPLLLLFLPDLGDPSGPLPSPEHNPGNFLEYQLDYLLVPDTALHY